MWWSHFKGGATPLTPESNWPQKTSYLPSVCGHMSDGAHGDNTLTPPLILTNHPTPLISLLSPLPNQSLDLSLSPHLLSPFHNDIWYQTCFVLRLILKKY